MTPNCTETCEHQLRQITKSSMTAYKSPFPATRLVGFSRHENALFEVNQYMKSDNI